MSKDFKVEKSLQKLETSANLIIRIVGSVIFVWLTWYSFRFTQYVVPGGEEIPIDTNDSMIRNILFLGFALTLLFGAFLLETKTALKTQKLIARCMLGISLLWTGVGGFWWITEVDRQPEGDQAYIYGGASMFIDGNFEYLIPSGYCGMYPYQLGLIFLVELFFGVVGTYNYFAIQVLFVILAVGIVWQGYVLVEKITEKSLLAALYCLFMMGCLPLIFYSGWVYGDIPSTFFLLLSANMLISYGKKGGLRYLAGVVLSMTMAVIVRQTSIILLIALCLVGGVWALVKRDKRLAVALVIAAISPTLIFSGIYKMYELRSGHEHAEGIPLYTTLVMGMQESNGKYGWDSPYCKQVYFDADCNPEVAAEVSKKDLEERFSNLVDNPGYAWTFFKGKVLSQWNEPLYESLYFSNKYQKGKAPKPDSFIARISTDYFPKVLGFCDGMQFMMYVGVLCYFLFAINKKSSLLQHLPVVGMLGGFFFSIIWEAKARYILPYYLMMYPMAVVGFYCFFKWALPCVERLAKKIQ